MNEIIQSKKFKITALIVGLLIILLGSFTTGVFVGLMKARFSYKFGENYERNFMNPRSDKRPEGTMGMMKERFEDFQGKDLRNAHGIAGMIISISENNIIVKDRDNKENTVAITSKTVIKSGRDDIKISDLKNDDQVVIIGKPDDSGAVGADLIRIFNKASN